MRLATYIRPFDAKQVIYVLDNNSNTVEMVSCDFSKYAEEVMQLITQYNIEKLNLQGSEEICNQIKRKVQSAEFNKYNNNQLVIIVNEE